MSRVLAVVVGLVAVASVAVLLLWDAVPLAFPAEAHLLLGAIPLVLVAACYLMYQVQIRPSRPQLLRACILAVAFLCWAENQLLGDSRLATLFNDLAIGLFVVDVFLTVVGWPAETGAKRSESSIIL